MIYLAYNIFFIKYFLFFFVGGWPLICWQIATMILKLDFSNVQIIFVKNVFN